MSIHSMQELCAGFCALALIAAPELRAMDDGVIAFNVTWHGVAVDVIAKPDAGPGHAFVLFDLGMPDGTRADPPRVLLALMHANFMALRANQPVFSCHPDTNAAVLQWALPLQDAAAADLYQVIEEGVNLARQWRETYFLPPGGDAGATSTETPPGAFA